MAKSGKRNRAPQRPDSESQATINDTHDSHESADSQVVVQVSEVAFPAASDSRLSISQYLIMNGIFYGACILILLFVRLTMQESRGLLYFFGLIMISFTLVSLYDFLFDRLSRETGSEA